MILAIKVQSYSIPGTERYPIPQNAGGHYSGMALLSNRLLSAILLVGEAALGVLSEPYEYTLPKFQIVTSLQKRFREHPLLESRSEEYVGP